MTDDRIDRLLAGGEGNREAINIALTEDTEQWRYCQRCHTHRLSDCAIICHAHD